ncbi:MAG: methyltransferase domain-containing protein [Gemmatimonadetes bacterium]|nr:methyltransferase domain-containing protein [Gemmatimonadota bacterium]MYG85527.1 methyltransferase domain-containing protein [Gemmatimonadota bacterium]MYJ91172.1 methyltransferase domain-containing protein [Gemmatimonadota bacterium]
MDRNVIRYYEEIEHESDRLEKGTARLEGERTREILRENLPAPPARILDAGGGPGAYAFWLAEQSYEVHLLDFVPRHIEQAKERNKDGILKSVAVGDARNLDFETDSMDAVLLMGPLYHLPARSDRIGALEESLRVLKQGGVLICAAISRFASFMDGIKQGYLFNPEFAKVVLKDLNEGRHENPEMDPRYFTTACFHRTEDLEEEITDAGFDLERTIGLEGPAWLLGNFDELWADEAKRKDLLTFLKLVETESSLIGVSAHILSVAKAP